MEFTPIIPTDISGIINNKHLQLAEKICIKSAALKGWSVTFIPIFYR